MLCHMILRKLIQLRSIINKMKMWQLMKSCPGDSQYDEDIEDVISIIPRILVI